MHTDDRSRPDLAMAKFVEHGVSLAATHGQTEAAAYLAARGVPDAVIARVLCEPGRRRMLPREEEKACK